MSDKEAPVVTATVSVIFVGGQIDITPGEQGRGSIVVHDPAGHATYDNIPDDFWYQLHGILQAKGFSA